MHALYDVIRKFLFVVPAVCSPLQFFINAPFGRFTPSTDSIFLVDGIRSWIVMELVSPACFIYALTATPFASSPADTQPLAPAQLALAGLFLTHYANRAIISPLRTPSRSKAHIGLTISGVIFNIVNGILLGSYLHSNVASSFLTGAVTRPIFWAGITIWALGFAGNILHDEVLLDIRRNAKAKGKAKAKSDDDHPNNKPREYYGIPHGYLYTYISFPNYLCEWSEWFGFALAAAPIPLLTSLDTLVSSLQPPWIFFSSEVFFMFARAYKGHQWYREKFPDYPKDRKAVVPYIF